MRRARWCGADESTPRGDEHDGHMCRPQDGVDHTAVNETPRTGAAVGGHHDQVDGVRLRDAADHASGGTDDGARAHLHALLGELLGDVIEIAIRDKLILSDLLFEAFEVA